MAIVVVEVTFESAAPPLVRIIERVTALTGLTATVRGHESADAEIFDLFVRLRFECVPEQEIEVTAYRPGAVRKQMQEAGMADQPIARFVQGANEREGAQTIYLRGFEGQEPTLLMSTALALEALGGRIDHGTISEFTDERRRKYGTKITVAELKSRHRSANKVAILRLLTVIVMLPLLIPFWLLGAVWLCLSMPFRLWRGYQIVLQQERARNAGKPVEPAS